MRLTLIVLNFGAVPTNRLNWLQTHEGKLDGLHIPLSRYQNDRRFDRQLPLNESEVGGWEIFRLMLISARQFLTSFTLQAKTEIEFGRGRSVGLGELARGLFAENERIRAC